MNAQDILPSGYTHFALMQNRHDREEMAVIDTCSKYDIPFVVTNNFKESFANTIPVGTVEWCQKILGRKIKPSYYPDYLSDHFHRKIWRTDKWPVEKNIFIKPADSYKRFTGFLTLGGYRKKKKTPYYCSEPVKFINEWRYYVLYGKVLTAGWYDGTSENNEAPDLIANGVKIPEEVCGAFDFGTLSTGEFALVEYQHPFACGWYGESKDNYLYTKWLAFGWDYVIREKQ